MVWKLGYVKESRFDTAWNTHIDSQDMNMSGQKLLDCSGDTLPFLAADCGLMLTSNPQGLELVCKKFVAVVKM